MYDKMALVNALVKHLYACTECIWPSFESTTVQADQNKSNQWVESCDEDPYCRLGHISCGHAEHMWLIDFKEYFPRRPVLFLQLHFPPMMVSTSLPLHPVSVRAEGFQTS